jgi:hypothetical protein
MSIMKICLIMIVDVMKGVTYDSRLNFGYFGDIELDDTPCLLGVCLSLLILRGRREAS